MRVLRAEAMGMCFGVRDALSLVHALDEPNDVTIHGELVHNERVIVELGRRGFRQTAEAERKHLPKSPRVVITAHGISQREETRLRAAGKELIDATCPLVRRVHQAAQDLDTQGFFVIILGQPGHAEVEGLIGDLSAHAVVPDEASARVYDATRLGLVCQSTTSPELAGRIRRAIERLNPGKEIVFVDTICKPTKDRQDAVTRLLGQVDALIVVGGRHSNNTRHLASLAAARGVPVAHVQGPDDLDRDWLAPHLVVGLTAGTSTPDETIEEVHQALLRIEEDAGQL